MSDSKDVVQDALRCVRILNKHLDEESCQHTLKEIATEAFQ